ncbi:MAG: hypothetical protein IKY38_05825, partial [Anaerotignum sp.]|nr:hypothetical protein [Anaerotignum sp.]
MMVEGKGIYRTKIPMVPKINIDAINSSFALFAILFYAPFSFCSKNFDKSLAIKPAREVFYENAALSLHFGNDPQKTLYLLKRMSEESGCENFLHSGRLRSVAYFRLGDIAASKRALDE